MSEEEKAEMKLIDRAMRGFIALMILVVNGLLLAGGIAAGVAVGSLVAASGWHNVGVLSAISVFAGCCAGGGYVRTVMYRKFLLGDE